MLAFGLVVFIKIDIKLAHTSLLLYVPDLVKSGNFHGHYDQAAPLPNCYTLM